MTSEYKSFSLVTDGLLEAEKNTTKQRKCCAQFIFSFSTSWRSALIAGAVCSLCVLLINLAITVWIASTRSIKDGQGVVFEGNCSTSKRLNIGIHVGVNILGTVLLGASNYCMQCLSAPTRSEVSQAHAKMVWLDIGIPSYRNLRWINPNRTILWICVALSSLPLHLFYNSVFYASEAAIDYQAFILPETVIPNITIPLSENYANATRLIEDARAGYLEKLSISECVDFYGQSLQFTRGNVLLIAAYDTYDTTEPIPNIHVSITPGCDRSGWVCSTVNQTWTKDYGCDRCTPDLLETLKKAWYIASFRIDHCLSERTQQKCKINFSIYVAGIVLVVNTCKMLLFILVAVKIEEDPLMTIGDAIKSFLKKPDPSTEGMCLSSRADFENEEDIWQHGTGPRFFYSEPKRWSRAASKKRWTLVFLLYGLALAVCIFVAFMTVSDFDLQSSAPGKISLTSLKPAAGGLIGSLLKANIAQTVTSLIYVTYNALLTSLLLAKEWDNYAHHRKGLRISNITKGAQRSTYFLQLPYSYGIPLMVVSGTLHWLISQTLYLVSIEVYSTNNVPSSRTSADLPSTYLYPSKHVRTIVTTSFSNVGLFGVLGIAILAIMTLIVLSRRRFKPGIPVAGSCSAAISATCHSIDTEPLDAVQMPLKWGVIVEPSNGRGVGHCSFSSLEVSSPLAHRTYAGICKTTAR